MSRPISAAISAAASIAKAQRRRRDPQPKIEARDPERRDEEAHPTQGPHATD